MGFTNTALLDEKIKKSGKKIAHLAEACGLSRQGFDNCRYNKAYFKTKHIAILRNELNIVDLEESEAIFFAH